MVAMVIITLTCSVISELAASSRQLWSFARDGGLPLSSAISKVRMPRPFDPTRELILVIGTEGLEYPNQRRLPVLDDHNLAVTHQHRLNGCVERDGVRHSHSVYGIVYHHNWLRADETHSRRTSSATPLSLGRYGMAINAASLVFLTPLFLFAFFPLATPVTPSEWLTA